MIINKSIVLTEEDLHKAVTAYLIENNVDINSHNNRVYFDLYNGAKEVNEPWNKMNIRWEEKA